MSSAARRQRAEEVIVPRSLKAAEAARYIGVSETKLRELVERRALVEFRIDGCVRFDIRKLDAFIDALSSPEEGNSVDAFFQGK